MLKKLPTLYSGKMTILLILSNVIFLTALHSKELSVASSRQSYLIQPILEKFTKETGIEVKLTTGKAKELIKKVKAHKGVHDIFLTTDASYLYEASQLGLFDVVRSKELERNIPHHLKDPGRTWFALSLRARTLIYNKEAIDVSAINSLKDIADRKYQGKLLLRTSEKIYNKSLVAMMIAQYGYDNTKEIVKGWVSNLALKPMGSDVGVIKAIYTQRGVIGIVNSYYLAKFLRDFEDAPIDIKFLDADEGVHVNISGAGVLRGSPHKKEAIIFLEWLSGKSAQKLFASLNLEYPVNPKVEPDAILKKWGVFKQNPINVRKAGELRKKAEKLMEEVGYE